MKLNLLPTYVSKEKATRSALIFGILIFAACIFGSYMIFAKANADLADSTTDLADLQGKAARAVETANKADTVMKASETLLRDTGLAEAMLAHNKTYPDTYDEIKQYIPSFYRVTSMSAAPAGPGVSTITLVGVLDTYQQYADLMLALLRIKGVAAVSRAGFTNNSMYVPAPTPDDQYGKPHKPGEAAIPDDPIKRLEYFQGQGRLTGYANAGGFGSGVPGLRGPMPNASQVTVTITMARELQTPDPKATLAMNVASSGGGNSGGPGGTGGQLPNGGGANNTPPPANTAPTTTTPPARGRGGRRGANAGDDTNGD